jgi:uncharacterized protein (TIGR02117 family)
MSLQSGVSRTPAPRSAFMARSLDQTTAMTPFRRALRYARMVLALILIALSLPIGYLSAAWGFSLWPANSDFRNDGPQLLFVRSNGVHTDLIFPLHRPGFYDWRERFPESAFPQLPEQPAFIAIGWGDLGFYIDTPQWRDLQFSTAWRALSGKSPSVFHVELLSEAQLWAQSELFVLRVRAAQLQQLEAYVRDGIAAPPSQPAQRVPAAHYGAHDAFFFAKGHYSMWRTCNTWTADALQQAGIRVARWSPFAFGITRWLERFDNKQTYPKF